MCNYDAMPFHMCFDKCGTVCEPRASWPPETRPCLLYCKSSLKSTSTQPQVNNPKQNKNINQIITIHSITLALIPHTSRNTWDECVRLYSSDSLPHCSVVLSAMFLVLVYDMQGCWLRGAALTTFPRTFVHITRACSHTCARVYVYLVSH